MFAGCCCLLTGCKDPTSKPPAAWCFGNETFECLRRSLRRLRLVLTDQEKSQPSSCIPSALGTALSALANRQQMLTMGSPHPTPTFFPPCSLAAGPGALTAPCLSFPSCRCVKIVLCNLGEGYVIQYGDRFLLKGANQKLQT